MSLGLWFVLGAIVLACALFAGGTVRVALATRSLMRRAGSMTKLDIDLDKARATIAHIESDLTQMAELFGRAQEAMAAIDTEVRAMLRVFSRE